MQRLFGNGQRLIVSYCIRSVVDRRSFSSHHYNEAIRAIVAKIDVMPDYKVMAAMLGVSPPTTVSFGYMAVSG